MYVSSGSIVDEHPLMTGRQEYREVDRTYSDIAQVLAQYPSLSPRTEVFGTAGNPPRWLQANPFPPLAFEHGASALLLLLKGNLAVPFRGATYRYPLNIWVPHGYPRESPTVFVVPSQDMAVRPGQHVSIEGRVYHPYLAQWQKHWDVSTRLEN